MRKLFDKSNFIYALVTVVFTIITNQLVYQGSKLINLHLHIWDISTPIDHTFRLVPWTIGIYVGSYVFWFFAYFIIAMQDDRKQVERFFAAALLAKAFCLVLFLALPTGADLRPAEVVGTSFWAKLTRFIYAADSPAVNYFPSLHCLASWLCFIGVRGKKEFPLAWRIASFFLAVAVFVSTITTRQHVLVDVPGGIVFAELSWALSDFDAVKNTYAKIINWIMVHIFRQKDPEST